MASDPSASWPPKFTLNERIPCEETQRLEFKEVTSKNPVRTITDTVEDYIVAFLNGEGGRILWGIRDEGAEVIGVLLNAAARDEVRKAVAAKIHAIQPAVDPSRYHLDFHRITGIEVHPELCIVEVSVAHIPAGDPYYNHSGDAFVRLNGVKQKLVGPSLTAWIKTRLRQDAPVSGSIDDPKIKALVQRIRLIFSEHGLEPAHLGRFLEIRKAPFALSFRDIQTDAALLNWLDESKIDWIAKTFLIRREWIDGEDNHIHERFLFDKQPEHFLTTISQHVDTLVYDEIHDTPRACFIRWGVNKEWERKGDTGVFVVIAVPLARFSNERTIYKYITDFTAYPWNYGRTQIQLRAWARLLDLNKHIACYAYEIPYTLGQSLESNDKHLRDLIETKLCRTRDDWHPEDYGLYPSESRAAKDTQNLHHIIEFLKTNNLPWEEISLIKSSNTPPV